MSGDDEQRGYNGLDFRVWPRGVERKERGRRRGGKLARFKKIGGRGGGVGFVE